MAISKTTDPFLILFSSLDSSHLEKSNGGKIIKNGSILTELDLFKDFIIRN